MPVSPLPPLIAAGLVLICLVRLLLGGRRGLVRGLIEAAVTVAVLIGLFFMPGAYWRLQAASGDPKGMYEYARWCEKHSGEISQVLPWPFDPDVESGYCWLEQAAAHQHPEAIFTLGVRIKYGDAVPQPGDTSARNNEPGPQPERGQKLIDQAIASGFEPPDDERQFYRRAFR